MGSGREAVGRTAGSAAGAGRRQGRHAHPPLQPGRQEVLDPGEFKLDPEASPKEIDFTPTDKDNPNKGKAYLGLYEVTAGRLRICYRGPGSTRPKDFNDKSAGNEVTTFVVLKLSPGA